ncbi:MAG: glycoside hydrolase family 78 protein [Muribaculaceae bacterium]|nr:glycoside hydrolase family 78 protein [Muribaculaceae bacterium]
MKHFCIAGIAVAIAATSVFPTTLNAHVELSHPTVDGRTSPRGLDEQQPRFGWRIESDKQNVMQDSYRILVASSKEFLKKNQADAWDSGTVTSDASQWIEYGGAPLSPGTEYFWKAIVTTTGDTGVSEISSSWTTGLMSPANWTGSWIGVDSLENGEKLDLHGILRAKYLRKEFNVDKKIHRATMYISGLGNYELYINGSKAGDDVLTPLPTEYNRTVAYDTYDVTPLLGERNALGVVLGPGHFTGMVQNYQVNMRTSYGLPRLLANLVIEYEDGTKETIPTDTTWRLTSNGPIRNTQGYDGETYDARNTLGEWTRPGYDDSAWRIPSKMEAPKGSLKGSLAPNMHIYATEHPISIKSFGKRHILDFGTNQAGRIRIRVNGNAGDTITIRHAELLQPGDSLLYTANLRDAEAAVHYVSDGQPREYAPTLTYYGFRYAEINGPETLDLTDIRRELIADRMDDTDTEFSVVDRDGNNMLNLIIANARRGVISNYKGFPIDCPQRDERMPWLGDRTSGSLGESYLFNNHALYSKWMNDIIDSQQSDGNISDVSPAYWRLYSGNVTWPAALPFTCDMLYRQYGDIRPMARSYEGIKKFLNFIRENKYTDGLVTHDTYGDWCLPPESLELIHSKDPARITDGALISSTYYQYICRLMAEYARILNKPTSEIEYFTKEADTTTSALNDKFLANGTYSNGTVTANLLPLAMHLVPAQYNDSVKATLLRKIEIEDDAHINSGVIGIQWLMRYLSECGRGDLAYRIASTDTYPGWGYMVKNNATTIWELWNGNTADPAMNSGNHVMLLGDLVTWCYQNLGGINPDAAAPGFKHIVIKPEYSINQIESVTVSHPSPYGPIKSSWTKRDGKYNVNVTIPANTTADVHLPSGDVRHIGSGSYTFSE